MPKPRTHNEHFRVVSLNNRKSCPTCKAKLQPNERIWSWGEYHNVRWHTVKHFCRSCFLSEVHAPLVSHTDDCGCTVQLVFHSPQPKWLTLTTDISKCSTSSSK